MLIPKVWRARSGSLTTYHAPPPDWTLRTNSDEVRQAIGQPGHLLVDARTAEMFSGPDKSGIAHGGHIPRAVNLAARRETHPDRSSKVWHMPSEGFPRIDGSAVDIGTFESNEEGSSLLPQA